MHAVAIQSNNGSIFLIQEIICNANKNTLIGCCKKWVMLHGLLVTEKIVRGRFVFPN